MEAWILDQNAGVGRGAEYEIRDFALAVARRDHVLIEKSLYRVLKVSIQDLVPPDDSAAQDGFQRTARHSQAISVFRVLSYLKEGNYLVTKDSDRMMIIEDIQVDTDAENGNRLTVTGR